MKQFSVIASILFLATTCFAQYKPLIYKFATGQRITVKIAMEANGEKRTGLIPIFVDSIDERGGAHITVLPTEYGEYLGSMKFSAFLTPRGQLRVTPHELPREQEIAKSIKTDTVYRSIWGDDASAMAYQFLFPYLPRNSGIDAALNTIQNASYARRTILSDDEYPGTDVVASHNVETQYSRGKSFIYRGEKVYILSRTENETEENCLQRGTYKFWRIVSNAKWTVRERDGAVLREEIITYKISPDGSWQGITIDFNASNRPTD